MLQLKKIVKTYLSGENSLTALKGVDVTFRHNEFVSILGQSGCGKTTLLNIIGGLDQCTEGDLIINGRSTRHFKARDWDTYRNHTIGFVFQSYNLIPHQSVLQNVEIALTLSGVSKAERRRRAKEALAQVGLSDQMRKRPGQMSGGQMQRVAIARALVNNPDIILADEPTGALDTETSVQVMDILKEVAKDRLVIMVTHNPDLAAQYSTRIIRMLDGQITGDTAPLTNEEINNEHALEKARAEEEKKKKRPSMSLFTSFGLSLKNLLTKKGRTALTSFAGSIGIIGIALIYAVSQGMTTYIDTVQEDTLSSYPLTLEETHTDMSSLLVSFMGNAQSSGDHDKDAVYQKTMFYDMVNALNDAESTENDLRSFKKYLEDKLKETADENETALNDAINGVQYTYDTNMLVYTENVDGTIIQSDTQELLQELLIEYFGMDLSSMMSLGEAYGMNTNMAIPGMSSAVLWTEMLADKDGSSAVNPLLEKQYDVIYGSWPNEYNEVVLVVDENNEIDDMTLYALGLKSKEEVDALADAALNKTDVDIEHRHWSFEEICAMDFRVVFAADCYTYDENTGTYTDLRESQAGMKYLYDNGLNITVSGIIRPNPDATSAMLDGTIGYTNKLTEYIIENSKDAAAITAQLKDQTTDIFTGLPFKENTSNLTDEEKATAFKKYINSITAEQKANTYVKIMSIPSAQQLEGMVSQAKGDADREKIEATMATAFSAQMNMSHEEILGYLASMSDEDLDEMYTQMITEQVKGMYAAQVKEQMSSTPSAQLAATLSMAMDTYTTEQCAVYYDEVLEFSESTYEDNLLELGYVDIESPSSINIYASSFENKDIIEEMITEYNKSVDELSKIAYTDYVGLMMSSITTIINAITYVLISFVAISLLVSSIMIGVITLISVQERTKEIGILRAIGASKRNVSSMFNAETMLIGFTSGLLGVGITYLLCIPINLILNHLTGIPNLRAYLPIETAIVLIIISVLLTLISGIIPSRSAAKKDPVVALRTE